MDGTRGVRRCERHAGFWCENVEERERVKDVNKDARIILQ